MCQKLMRFRIVGDYQYHRERAQVIKDAYDKLVTDAAGVYGKTYQDCIDAKKNTDAECKTAAQKKR